MIPLSPAAKMKLRATLRGVCDGLAAMERSSAPMLGMLPDIAAGLGQMNEPDAADDAQALLVAMQAISIATNTFRASLERVIVEVTTT